MEFSYYATYALTVHTRQRRDLIGCSELGRLVLSQFWTHVFQCFTLELAIWSSVLFISCALSFLVHARIATICKLCCCRVAYTVAGFCRTAAKLVASCLIEVFYFSLLRMDLIALFVTVNFGDDFTGIVKYVSK